MGKFFSVDRLKSIALVGVGATAYGAVDGSGALSGVNGNMRDGIFILGAIALAGYGGETIRAVALGFGGGAVASLIGRNMPSVGA